MAPRVPLTPLDQVVPPLEPQPWPIGQLGVFMELRVAGALVEERLRDAISAACRRHPLVRSRLLPAGPLARNRSFELVPEFDRDPLAVGSAGGDAEVERLRSGFFNRTDPLDRAPQCSVLLVRQPGGDRLFVSVAHVAADGIGTAAFVRSIQRAYAGEPDPAPPVGMSEARDIQALLGSGGWRAGWERSGPVRRYLASLLGPVAALAFEPTGEPDQRDAHRLRFGPDELARLNARRPPGTTLNDLLLGALHLASDRWNALRGRPTDRVSTLLPMNVRPREWSHDLCGNYVVGGSASTRPADRSDLARAAQAVALTTTELKRTRGGGTHLLMTVPAHLPVGLKRLVARATPERLFGTSGITNLTRIRGLGGFGDDGGDVLEYWFSAPIMPPIKLGMSVASLNDEMFLVQVTRRAAVDPKDAAQFLDLFHETLCEG